jgi:hypothetical protein
VAAVRQHLALQTPRLFERISQDRQIVEPLVLVDPRRDADNRRSSPSQSDLDRSERVAEDVTQEGHLGLRLRFRVICGVLSPSCRLLCLERFEPPGCSDPKRSAGASSRSPFGRAVIRIAAVETRWVACEYPKSVQLLLADGTISELIDRFQQSGSAPILEDMGDTPNTGQCEPPPLAFADAMAGMILEIPQDVAQLLGVSTGQPVSFTDALSHLLFPPPNVPLSRRGRSAAVVHHRTVCGPGRLQRRC